MENKVIVRRSPNPKKKWRVTFSNGTSVNFGATGYENYTEHQNLTRRARYIARHQKREHWTAMRTAGFWSRWLLWEKPTMRAAANEITSKFNVHVVVLAD
jgi:hypothetical protein